VAEIASFFIPIEVMPKQSFRVSRRGGYSDREVKANAKSLAFHATMHRPAKPLDCPVVVSYMFCFEWGPRHSKKFRSQPTRPKMTIPDLGNLEKQMDDVLELAGMVTNDSRIYRRNYSGKVWCSRTGVEVTVETL
jgi:Holliday junction resolvase RusA-like endonuclease